MDSLFVHRYHSTDPTGSTQFQHGQPEWSRAVADLRQQNGIRTRTINNCCSSHPISTGGFGCPGVIKLEILCWDVSSRKIPMCVSFRKRCSVFVFLKTMVFDMKICFEWKNCIFLLLLYCVQLNILKTSTLQVHAGLFGCFYNPLNSEMDCRIFSMCVVYLHAYIHGGPWFIVSSEGLSSVLHRICLWKNLRVGTKPSM